MTTLSTRTDQQGTGLRRLLGATALTLLVVGAAAVWLVRPGGDTSTTIDGDHVATAPPPSRAIAPARHPESTATTAPLDVPALTDGAGRYLAEAQISAMRASGAVMPMGSLAELYAEQQAQSESALRPIQAGGACGLTTEPADC
jgi:hypothetical protein